MSTKLLDDSNLDLLIPSPIQASWQALAFCRTPRVCALGAPRAHVLHARALSRRAALPPSTRPISGPCSPAEPRHALAFSPVHSKLSLAPYSAALAARRRRQRALPWSAPPKPPARASCPGEQPVLIHLLVGTLSSPPRCPATTEKWSPAILSSTTAGAGLERLYKGTPSSTEH